MKKKLLPLLLAACLLTVSASATGTLLISPNPLSSDPWGLTMTVKDATSDSGTVVFTQSGGSPSGELTTGEPYRLEVEIDGQWIPVEGFDDMVWIMPAYPIPQNDSRELSVNWVGICGSLPVGSYRIAKSVTDFRAPGDFDEKVYRAEFTVTPESSTARSLPFSDVLPGTSLYPAVEYVYESGLMQGKTSSQFRPGDPITRGQIAAILWRQEGTPVVNYLMPFNDVPQDAYYTEAIRWAAAEKVVEGYADGTFRPDAPVSRQQLCTILWRYAKHTSADVSVGEDTNILSYNDAFDISEYAIPAMQWACGAGVMCGHEDGNLRPLAPASRGTAAQMLTVLLQP